ncbi:MAG: HAD-IA family hydrolase [Chloroflexaceae bacterium]|nr:HAD-IA family hydrolase [Chloroflexaceae bacterium]
MDALIAHAISKHIYAPRLPALLQQMGIDDLELCRRAQERYRHNDYSHLRLYDGAEAMLQRLRPTHRLGLITNGPVFTQRPKIEQFRLARMMDVLVISEEVGIAKPHPRIFQLTLRHLGVAPARALYVGDSLRYDLMGAMAAGVDFVWMNPHCLPLPADMPQPRAAIQHLEEILPIIERIGGAGSYLTSTIPGAGYRGSQRQGSDHRE